MNEGVYFVDAEFVIKLKHISRKEASEAESELLEVLHKQLEGTGHMAAKFTSVESHSHKV
jgi:hypothetical protein